MTKPRNLFRGAGALPFLTIRRSDALYIYRIHSFVALLELEFNPVIFPDRIDKTAYVNKCLLV